VSKVRRQDSTQAAVKHGEKAVQRTKQAGRAVEATAESAVDAVQDAAGKLG
jgi:hypothetical protein